LAVSPSIPNSRIPVPLFSPLTESSLDGIICHLTREHGGNVHDRGIVDISSSSIFSSCPAKNAADFIHRSRPLWATNRDSHGYSIHTTRN
jgi:hypothetical protein